MYLGLASLALKQQSAANKETLLPLQMIGVTFHYSSLSISSGEELDVISCLRCELDLSPSAVIVATQLSQQRHLRQRRPSKDDPRDIDVIILVRHFIYQIVLHLNFWETAKHLVINQGKLSNGLLFIISANFAQNRLQWVSEHRTSLVFKWSNVV